MNAPRDRRPYAERRVRSRARITGGTRPPWPEHEEYPSFWDHGSGVVQSEGPKGAPRIHPDRPMEWHEFVVDGKVQLRSQRPLHILKTVCEPGCRIYLARRDSPNSGVLSVSRYLVYGLVEGS